MLQGSDIGSPSRVLATLGSWASVLVFLVTDTYLFFILGATVLGYLELRKVSAMVG